jgi:hypothetical protein
MSSSAYAAFPQPFEKCPVSELDPYSHEALIGRRRAAEQRDEIAPPHVWMAPAWQEEMQRAAQKSLAVMCPACSRSPDGLLGPDGVREPRPHHSSGIHVPMKRQASLGCVGATDCAITWFSLSQARGTWHAHMLVLLRVGRGPVYS